MPYRLTWEPRGVYREYFDDVTIAERRASLVAICSDPRFDDLRYSITDYRNVATYEVTRDDTAEVAAFHVAPLRTNPQILIAAVTTRPDIIAVIEEFIGHGFTRVPYRIFPSIGEAREWVTTSPR